MKLRKETQNGKFFRPAKILFSRPRSFVPIGRFGPRILKIGVNMKLTMICGSLEMLCCCASHIIVDLKA